MNIQDNIERYPEFELNDRTKRLLDITFAIVPKENQWIVNLFGMKGDFQKGIQSLERISLFDDHWGTEAQMMLKLINAYILEDEYEKRLNNTAFENYIEGLYLLKQHDPANAAKYFKTLSDDIPVRSYLLGESHFLQGEYQQAKTFYKSYIQSSLGSNYVKDAYLKLALSEWFKYEKNQKVIEYLDLAKAIELAQTEIDKNAKRILANIDVSRIEMLELRYLIDGGNYQSASKLADQLTTLALSATEKAELTYRKAIIAQLSGDKSMAIVQYEQVIHAKDLGTDNYYIPYSYLQLGKLYEDSGQFEKAQSYLKKAIEAEAHPYEQSVRIKALNRLNELNHLND